MTKVEEKPKIAKNETGQLLGKNGGFISVAITESQRSRLDKMSGGMIPISKLIRKAIEDFLVASGHPDETSAGRPEASVKKSKKKK